MSDSLLLYCVYGRSGSRTMRLCDLTTGVSYTLVGDPRIFFVYSHLVGSEARAILHSTPQQAYFNRLRKWKAAKSFGSNFFALYSDAQVLVYGKILTALSANSTGVGHR